MTHTVKGFGLVKKAEVEIVFFKSTFLNTLFFLPTTIVPFDPYYFYAKQNKTKQNETQYPWGPDSVLGSMDSKNIYRLYIV